MLRYRIIHGPQSEPVSVAEVKAHTFVDHSADDADIAIKLAAARQLTERYLGRALMTQTLAVVLDRWPAVNHIRLPFAAPCQAIQGVIYRDSAENEVSWPETNWLKDLHSEPARVVLGCGKTWPSITLSPRNPVEVRYIAGWMTAADVPAAIKQAILLLVGHWYRNREAVVVAERSSIDAKALPMGYEALISAYRVDWFGEIYEQDAEPPIPLGAYTDAATRW